MKLHKSGGIWFWRVWRLGGYGPWRYALRKSEIVLTYDGWRPIALEVNWEDNELYCAHTNRKIECAYPQE